jgi:ABC-type glycerol-3-phosphate transport system permease component
MIGVTARRRLSKLNLIFISIFVSLLIAFPVYWMLVTSILPLGDIFADPPRIVPTSFDFSAYTEAFERGTTFGWIWHSFIVSAGVVVLNLLLSVPAAYSMARFKITFNGVLILAVLSTQLIPAVIFVVPLFEIFRVAGLIDTFLALILADSIITLPISTWILMGFFEGVPKEIEEVALVDGCTRYGVFFRIALPIVRPAMVTVAILIFYEAWNEYLFARTLITKQSLWVGTVGLGSFLGQFQLDWRGIMANAIYFAILPLAMYIGFRGLIVRGIAEGFSK